MKTSQAKRDYQTKYRLLNPEKVRSAQILSESRNPTRQKKYYKKWASNNREEIRRHNVLHYYHMTAQEHNALLEKQAYRCAFSDCGLEVDLYSAIDHNHGCCPGKGSCGKCVRGILCRRHNLGLGLFEALNPKCLLNAFDYLVKL